MNILLLLVVFAAGVFIGGLVEANLTSFTLQWREG